MNPRLDIGLLTPACRGYNAVDGGIASHFADLAAGLIELGHTVRVIVTDASPSLPALQAELAAVDFIAVPAAIPAWLQRLTAWHWPLHTLASRRLSIHRAARALRLAHAVRPFHCLETDSCGLLALEYLRTSPRPPVVTRVSTTTAQLVAYGGGRARWHERVLQRWERRLVRESEMVLTHTNEHRREIAREFDLDAGRVRLVSLGIALPADDELAPPAGADRPPRLLYVGRFEHRKGIDTLLAALPAVLSAVPTATCRLVGRDSGGYWQGRFWRDNPGIGRERVTFAGPVDSADLRAAYRECDVFVAPSRYESFGLIYVEAMAWGKPVVGCRAGGVPEVVADGETGLLAAPGDVDDLRAKLIRLLDQPSLRIRMGQAGRVRVQTHFSRATLARHSAELYAEVAARRRYAA
jgi:glycosyltransferase involved in cell wall biosynthesis